MGKTHTAYNNTTPTAGTNVKLSASLGVSAGRTAGTQISLSSTLGGKTTPYTYTP